MRRETMRDEDVILATMVILGMKEDGLPMEKRVVCDERAIPPSGIMTTTNQQQ